jgi:uncharacterized membrane protein YdjX (TVP38/TMEM64 family)
MEVLISFAAWLEGHRELSGLVYVLVFAGVMTVGIPGGGILVLSAGLLFGFINGTILASTGAAISALLVHSLMRTTFGSRLDRRSGKTAELRAFIERGNWEVLVLVRLIPLIPFFALNVAITAIGIPRRLYIVTTMAGVIPIIAIFAWIGSGFRSLDELSSASLGKLMMSPQMLVPLVLLILVIGVASLLLRRQQRTD